MSLFFLPKQRAIDNAGVPIPAARLFFYENQTSVPKSVFSDANFNIPHTNPVVSDAYGLFPQIWLDASTSTYTVKLTTSTLVEQWTVDDIGDQPLTAEQIADMLNSQSQAEIDAGIDPLNTLFSEEYIQVKRYAPPGTPFDGLQVNAAAHTLASKHALLVANQYTGARVVWEHGGFVIDEPLVPDSDGLELICDGADLIQGANIPSSGAIICSLSGGDDATTNQGVLDGIYGSGVVSVRINKPNSLVDVRFTGLRLRVGFSVGPTRGIHMVGFTRGCAMRDVSAVGFREYGIVLNGSWSCTFDSVRVKGNGTEGTGFALGITGGGAIGTRDGATACNAINARGLHCGDHATGMVYDFGAYSKIDGTFEGNAGYGFDSQSMKALELGGYFENNATGNISLGGTNGTDYVDTAVLKPVYLNALAGRRNIRMNAVKNSWFWPSNRYDEDDSATYASASYYLPTGSGTRVFNNFMLVRDASASYITNFGAEFDLDANTLLRYDGGEPYLSTGGLQPRGEFRHMGSTLGLYSATAVTKQTVSGIRDSNAALADALTELAEVGIITDSTTAT